MTEYFVEKPMPQFGKDIYSCIPIPNEVVEKIRADAIDECKTILKTRHMFRTCEDDYNAKIEVPFYKGLWKSFEKLKEQNNGNNN